MFDKQHIEKLKKWGNVTPNGVVFEDEVTSIDGCTFYLLKTPKTTLKMIAEAKRYIRHRRDVVKFYVIRKEETDD